MPKQRWLSDSATHAADVGRVVVVVVVELAHDVCLDRLVVGAVDASPRLV
jgi:hypothetical protein